MLGGMAGCTVTVHPLTCTNALSGVGDKPRPLSCNSSSGEFSVEALSDECLWSCQMRLAGDDYT